MCTFFIALAVLFVARPATADAINPMVGDASWIAAYGRAPTAADDLREVERVSTHPVPGSFGNEPYPSEAGEATLERAIEGVLTSSEGLLLDIDTTRIAMTATYSRNIFVFPQYVPADEYDALLWLREVTPTTVR